MTRKPNPKLESYWTDRITDFTFWGPEKIPERMVGGMMRWIVYAIPSGHFLNAVFSNDMMEALSRADDENENLMKLYCGFLYNVAPRGCYGSAANCKEWRNIGGLAGFAAEAGEDADGVES